MSFEIRNCFKCHTLSKKHDGVWMTCACRSSLNVVQGVQSVNPEPRNMERRILKKGVGTTTEIISRTKEQTETEGITGI
ncbi:hypothetical protein ACTXT7_003680 [Hymenolepis weldensis]